MIPNRLEDWNLTIIKDILTKGYYESEYFDFKEMLPNKNDENGKQRLIKTSCAFANSEGGFLIFGIKNDNSIPVDERIVGINPSHDFPEHFGNFPNKCTPSVFWDFKNPPIKLSSGNVIHIVHIPKSWKAPHCLIETEKGWFFTKRTNKGDGIMSYDEVKTSFLGYYEKRLKLQLLMSELQNLLSDATSMILPESQKTQYYSLVKLELSVVESILSDTYTILVDAPTLLQLLNKIRNRCRIINNKQQIFYGFMPGMLDRRQKEYKIEKENYKDHNDYLDLECTFLAGDLREAIIQLEKIINS
ncbi:ATP-binding protein [Paenibacillus sp. GP183]|uniref:AlbA family DNA-binding domain-containing protein n=1 Tax=Paenibacillus sp. GP183 TaxID=1882751 RepID=UPI0008978E17|nr:ATP-binding protein [Paenibacillus sp. GP183]SEB93946.1 Putative DNA-binding domain-containing protein [Paenibacillus sp. GP183]